MNRFFTGSRNVSPHACRWVPVWHRRMTHKQQLANSSGRRFGAPQSKEAAERLERIVAMTEIDSPGFSEGGPIEPGGYMRAEDFDRLLSGLGCGCCPREQKPRAEITGTLTATFEFTPEGLEYLKQLPLGPGSWGVPCAVTDSKGNHCPGDATESRRGQMFCARCAANVDAGAYGK